jgi:hypothetical protein
MGTSWQPEPPVLTRPTGSDQENIPERPRIVTPGSTAAPRHPEPGIPAQETGRDRRNIPERPRIVIPGSTAAPRHPVPRIPAQPTESDRRKLLADIVRDLHVHHVTPETFRGPDRMITDIKIPEKAGVDKILATIKELKDDDWLYEEGENSTE